MRTTKELKKYFLEKYPKMDETIADAVSTLMLSREELEEEMRPKNPNLTKEFKDEVARTLASSSIKAAEELLSEAKPKIGE